MKPSSPYIEVLARLKKRGLFRIRPGLDRMRCVLAHLGNPHRSLRAVHIAGTNGKGSVAASLESILRRAGLRTGLYTSPHLFDVRERIRVNGDWIPPDDFSKIASRLFQAERDTHTALTYFEFLTALAFSYFVSRAIEIAVIEVGLGGRWDATNVLPTSELSMITSIGLDHMQWLGDTEIRIAAEKAAIIKPYGKVLSGVRGEPERVIEQMARRQKARLWQIDKDFGAYEKGTVWQDHFQTIAYQGKMHSYPYLRLGLLGPHQVQNAALTLAAVEALRERGWTLPDTAVKEGLASVSWPGRCQLLSWSPGPAILVDGAHNVPGIESLLQSLEHSPWEHFPKTFVFCVYKDKDYAAMARLISAQASAVILCEMPEKRSLPMREAFRVFAGQVPRENLFLCSDPKDALEKAVRGTLKIGLVVATGSLSVVGRLLSKYAIMPPI